jgi:hypothetical protein
VAADGIVWATSGTRLLGLEDGAIRYGPTLEGWAAAGSRRSLPVPTPCGSRRRPGWSASTWPCCGDRRPTQRDSWPTAGWYTATGIGGVSYESQLRLGDQV